MDNLLTIEQKAPVLIDIVNHQEQDRPLEDLGLGLELGVQEKDLGLGLEPR